METAGLVLRAIDLGYLDHWARRLLEAGRIFVLPGDVAGILSDPPES
jgi:hypothetical protein